MAETVEWIDPDGTTTTLQANWETTGRYAPPIEFEEDGVPGQPGLRFRDVRHGLKEFTQAIWITGSNESDLRTQIRTIVAKMDPTRGQGILRVTTPVGDQRQIRCYYSQGLGLSEVLGGDSGPLVQRAVLTFRAHYPYWEAVTATSNTYVMDATPVGGFFPFFPLRLLNSELVVDTTLTNGGDVDAWPVFTIFGGGTSIYLHNVTTGKFIDLTTFNLIPPDHVVVIDTRPGYKTIMQDELTNLWPYVSTTSSLWPLVRGDNRIRLEMGQALNGITGLTVSYTPLYLSP